MPPTTLRSVILSLIAVVLLGGCTEKRVGFEVTFSGTMLIAPAGLSPDGIVFSVPRMRDVGNGTTEHTRVSGAMLKIAGYLPVLPLSVRESTDRYTVAFRLPEDLLEQPRTPGPLEAELILPNETGVRSFTGREHFVPNTVVMSVRMQPVYTGPLTRLGAAVGDFLRGLYAAR